MKVARFFVKILFFTFLVLSTAVFVCLAYLEFTVDTDIKIKKGDSINFNTSIPVTATFEGAEFSGTSAKSKVGDKYSVELKVFGIFPFKNANVEVVDEMHVALLGTPFGMKIYTEGVLVIELTDVETENGNISPAKKAGIKVGDYILSVDGVSVSSNEDLSEMVEASKGQQMRFVVMRNGTKIHINCKAQYSKETDSYKIGLWIRDSSAGIGTLTFYSPATNIVSGLGHGVSDDDTGTLLEINSGEIVDAEIISYEKGSSGSPGKLNGRLGNRTIGKICYNCECGVYSTLTSKIDLSNMVEIALKNDVKNGKAKIYCAIEGKKPKYYDCTIKIRNSQMHSKTQNMIVTVTDKELLELTGGIVQGMSGSPIIQNGKLIGAVTHVLLDDCTKGYAIFAENMLETAQSVGEGSPRPQNNEQLKEAS